MQQVQEPYPVPGHVLGREPHRPVKDPQALERRDSVPDLATLVPSGVGEAEEKAGDSTEAKQG